MGSNEHPDMSGNPCDAPFYCVQCDAVINEEDICGDHPELTFCSSDCFEKYSESHSDDEPEPLPLVVTPEQCGASQLACDIVNDTFLGLDGFEPLRQRMDERERNATLTFASELARVTDRHLKAAKHRHCECLDCKHQWDAPLRKATATPNISGEPTNYCPECQSRNVMSGPAT